MARTLSGQRNQQRLTAMKPRPQKDKATEKELLAREGEWLDLVNNAAVGVFRASGTGKFLLVNREMARIFGFDTPKASLNPYRISR